MFILLKTGAMLNLFWLQDCFVGKHDKNIVIFYMVNGSKVIEEYETEQEAKDRVDEVHFAMDEAGVGDNKPLIVDELPTENISTRRSYLIRVSDDPEDGYQEWKYIEQPDGTFKWEMLGIQKDYSYSKEDIDTMISNINNSMNIMNSNISNLSNRVTNLETNMNTAQSDINVLQNNVSNINSDINVINNNISNIINTINIMNSNFTNNFNNITNDIININNVLEWHEY